MRQTAISFSSKHVTLEGVLAMPQELPQPYPAIVMCHPHPLLGGNMDSPVVASVCRAASEAGFASFRFNFRGVEGSEGDFENGDSTHEDIKAALNIIRRWRGIDRKRMALCGYSFGAGAILRGLRHFKSARALALIAPPLSTVEESRIVKDKRPKLFVVGENDRLVSSVRLQRALDGVREPVQFREVEGADHSLAGREWEVADEVVAFVSQVFGVD
ncbi:MAG: dienelactone hydrolase family protein [Chloroflexi bacterium]|nr:dienelactone hydrolase family protein [Chloroflexota bacterium]